MHFVHSPVDISRKGRRLETWQISRLRWSLDANHKCTNNVKTLSVRSATLRNLGLQRYCYKRSPILYILLHSGEPMLFSILN